MISARIHYGYGFLCRKLSAFATLTDTVQKEKLYFFVMQYKIPPLLIKAQKLNVRVSD